MLIRTMLLLLLTATATSAQPRPVPRNAANPETRTAQYLESVRRQPSLLLQFLREMPKGGDLHNHLSGAIYAEHYIQWAAEDDLCLNRQSFAFVPQPCGADKDIVSAKKVLTDATLYQQVINAQSMRFFRGPESGHDHFFDTFGKFGAVSNNHMGDMLAVMASEAAADHLSYLELLLDPDNGAAEKIIEDHQIVFDDNLATLRDKIIHNGLADAIPAGRSTLDQAESRMRELLHCGTPQASPGCNVTIRYQYQVLRGKAPAIAFSQMLTGLELASADPRVVDINPVMPEDAYVPMHDFDLHMRMLSYLHGLYPKVHLSLHAGELWTGLVPPAGLTYHIRHSIEIGNANRIGHGVDVMFENDPVGLLKEMAARKVAVEVNLSSNDQILGVSGKDHPLAIYLLYGVPVALSSDDQGVARSNMTQEYVRAVRDQGLNYPVLKRIVRNSLEFSFLPGKSLWTDATYSRRVPACAADQPLSAKPSQACQDLLAKSERARLQWRLEADLGQFETKTCCTATATPHPQSAVSMR